MEKVTINGKEYQLDVDKCKEQGLIIEEVNYPKSWEDFITNIDTVPCDTISARALDKSGYYDEFDTTVKARAFVALGKLIQLRDWWWDNMCDGWRPDWTNYNETKWVIHCNWNTIQKHTNIETNKILAFPAAEIQDKFYEAYKDLIEEAKMFL